MIYERAFMEGTLDAFEFVLAESLHKTIAQLRDEMSGSEYVAWRAFHTYRNEMQKLAAK
jgi:hypothetical protein